MRLRSKSLYCNISLCLFLLIFVPVSVVAQSGTYDWSNDNVRVLYPGIYHASIRTDEPRNLIINCVRIDTDEADVRFYTTERTEDWELGEVETIRQRTRDFLRAWRAEGVPMVVAMNADAFSPWPAPWDEPTPSTLLGLAISDGTLVSAPNGTPSFIVYVDGRMELAVTDASTELDNIHTAVSGFGFALRHGEEQPSGDDLHPRTGLGLSENREVVFFLAVDGRRHASRGITVHEVGAWLKHFGAYDGINMDGGGSTTLAWWNENLDAEDRAVLLNEPIAAGSWLDKTPEEEAESYQPTERMNGNNLGVVLLDAAVALSDTE